MTECWIALRSAAIALGLFGLGLLFRQKRCQVTPRNAAFYSNTGWGITMSGSTVNGGAFDPAFNIENGIFNNATVGRLDRYGAVTPGRYQIVSVSHLNKRARVYYPAGYVDL